MKNIYVLGPEGTFSNEAAKKINKDENYRISFIDRIEEIGIRLSKEPESLGVLPIENLVTGIVGQTQEILFKYRLQILRETTVKISFTCITNCDSYDCIQVLYAHPQAYNQCSEFISKNMKKAQPVFTESNIHSAGKFFENKTENSGAIIPSPFYREKNLSKQLPIPGKEIKFFHPNATRFIKVQSCDENLRPDFFFKKTSLFIANEEDRHSILFYILREFHTYEINIILLHSRPNFTKLGSYCFFIDFENNQKSAVCLKELDRQSINYRILGVYDTD